MYVRFHGQSVVVRRTVDELITVLIVAALPSFRLPLRTGHNNRRYYRGLERTVPVFSRHLRRDLPLACHAAINSATEE